MSVTPINYDQVQWAVKEVNKALMRGESGVLVQVTVNQKNEVQCADIVPLELAVANGFEAVRLMKGVSKSV